MSHNPCTNLSLRLGKSWPPGPKQAWGDVDTEKSRPGWVLFEQGGLYCLHVCLALGGRALRVNFGYKLGKFREHTSRACRRPSCRSACRSAARRGDPAAAAAQDRLISAKAKTEIAASVRHEVV